MKRVNETVWGPVWAAVDRDNDEPITWSVGYSHYQVLDTMRNEHWQRKDYRVAKCRLVEIPRKKRKVRK